MPYSDPERRKEYERHKYLTRKHLWKNPDGSWRKSNSDHLASSRKHYIKNKDTILAKRRKKTSEARLERTSACPTCGNEEVLVYDHDHKTGLFRSYICHACNLALGHARDNPAILRALAEYLECHKKNN